MSSVRVVKGRKQQEADGCGWWRMLAEEKVEARESVGFGFGADEGGLRIGNRGCHGEEDNGMLSRESRGGTVPGLDENNDA